MQSKITNQLVCDFCGENGGKGEEMGDLQELSDEGITLIVCPGCIQYAFDSVRFPKETKC